MRCCSRHSPGPQMRTGHRTGRIAAAAQPFTMAHMHIRCPSLGGKLAPAFTCRISCTRSHRRPIAPVAAIKEIFMPALSSTMTEGKIVSWLKSPGDKITKGESVVVVESDKADMDVESFSEGFLGGIVIQEGGTANVGARPPPQRPSTLLHGPDHQGQKCCHAAAHFASC